MADEKHLEILNQGVDAWNKWRESNPETHPDLRDAALVGMDLSGINFSYTSLSHANLTGVDLSGSDLSNAYLMYADFGEANLSGANFSDAYLGFAYITSAYLAGTNFTNAIIGWTSFGDTDLSSVEALETVIHDGPSEISINTLYKSAGKISEAFLLGCGVPDDFIEFIRSHFGMQQSYSCFISYSHKDEDFANRLHSRMRDSNMRVWFAPEEIKGGQKLHEQIERAIQMHDRLLLVLSENSL